MRVAGHSHSLRSERSVGLRIEKVLGFLSPPLDDLPVLTPTPWALPYPRYYISKPPRNWDGHGGYSRQNLFGADGMPFRLQRGRPEYHPLILARYAMRMLDVGAETGDADARRKAYAVLPPLLRSATATGALGSGRTAATMSSDIAHANIQGVAISALLRLYEGAPDPEGRRVLEAMTHRLLARIEEGGTRRATDGGSFLEEAPGTPLRYVLNGCVYGLFGLYDLRDGLGHDEAGCVAAEVERALARSAERYTTWLGWTLYAREAYGRPYLASAYYHALHANQLRVVALKSGSEELAGATVRWERALRSVVTRLTIAAAKSAQVLWMRDLLRLRLDLCP